LRPTEDPDRDLVDRASDGDRDAFESLLRRHYDRIHRVAWRLTGSRADAEDIAQDVCCTLVEKIGTFKGEAKFATWLMGRPQWLSRSRPPSRDVDARQGALVGARRPGLAPDGRDLYRRSWLASELSRIDPLLRETIVLVIGEDMTHAEAARALGVAESTVSGRMFEARRRLTRAKEGPDGL
jgi:RNA polymerase sigma-70 factor (ECF subfamily)